ncbi:hypothetical protein PR003_g14192 [Phytophthora rubi]|uniref:Uncharacterized protein n=1 Tax=Phytophthora rubi TaxID=129364 RepID=A0A6A3LT00_9STRA|nr:hypothetical protein PR002_g13671 [Phytophthora rubi]KAE9021440.1 hypothetical protein PR001_g13373 [Phytophthora rubi]KAE9333095.1 hypothetical protein PR003_g14192 [Phytophthora rubi]
MVSHPQAILLSVVLFAQQGATFTLFMLKFVWLFTTQLSIRKSRDDRAAVRSAGATGVRRHLDASHVCSWLHLTYLQVSIHQRCFELQLRSRASIDSLHCCLSASTSRRANVVPVSKRKRRRLRCPRQLRNACRPRRGRQALRKM